MESISVKVVCVVKFLFLRNYTEVSKDKSSNAVVTNNCIYCYSITFKC